MLKTKIRNLFVASVFLSLCFVCLIRCESDRATGQPEGVATLRIETEKKVGITSKTTYVPASISIENQGRKSKEKIQIRGRGNSSWTLPKKPYKIEFDSRIEFLGLPASKEWVLLANYLDGSLMLNAMAMKIGELLQMPYTNHAVPVDVWLNDQYQGSYILTEQIEVKENRVDINDDGLLLSLDRVISTGDQSFTSMSYNLPVIIKHPKNLTSSQIANIRTEFGNLEKAISDTNFPQNNYEAIIDIEALTNYFLVYLITCNEEINHPKSTFLYKANNGKYTMGPIWDFDWAFGYEERQRYYLNPNRSLFWERKALGETFFKRIYSDPKIKALLKQKWQIFKRDSYPQLLEYLENYSKRISASRAEDFKKWKRGNVDINVEKENLRNWFIKRAEHLDSILQ